MKFASDPADRPNSDSRESGPQNHRDRNSVEAVQDGKIYIEPLLCKVGAADEEDIRCAAFIMCSSFLPLPYWASERSLVLSGCRRIRVFVFASERRSHANHFAGI